MTAGPDLQLPPPNAITPWADFKAWVTHLIANGGSFLWRGHANDQWLLKTTFQRKAAAAGIDLHSYLDEVIPEVYYQVSAHVGRAIDLNVASDFGAFLAMLQHHGFPTPLLDWTLSPYVAAYFAFREVQEDGHAADQVRIYFFDNPSWARTFQQPLDLRASSPYVSTIRPYAWMNPRIVPQKGVFTVTNVDDIAAHVDGCARHVGRFFLSSVRVPVTEKPFVMRDLWAMGIDEASLFPGFDGLARSLAAQLIATPFGETIPARLRRIMATSPNLPTK